MFDCFNEGFSSEDDGATRHQMGVVTTQDHGTEHDDSGKFDSPKKISKVLKVKVDYLNAHCLDSKDVQRMQTAKLQKSPSERKCIFALECHDKEN